MEPKKPGSLLFISFLLVLVWLPLPLGSNRTWSSMLFCIFTLALSLCWLYNYQRKKTQLSVAFKKSITVFSLLSCAQLFVGYQYVTNQTIDLYATLQALILGTSLTLFFALSLLLINSRKRIRIRITCYVVIGSGVFQALFGSLMVLTEIEYLLLIPKFGFFDVATGTFVNRNHLAGYLNICLSIGIGIGMMIAGLKTNASSIKQFLRGFMKAILSKKSVIRISLIIMVAGLVMTHSRMGNTAFFASMGIIGTLAILLKSKSIGSTLILLTSLLIIDVAIVGTFFGVEKVIDRLEKTSTSSETRDEVNLYSIKLLDDSLYTGTGAGSFYTAFPQVREKDVGFIFYDHAHNDYMEFLTERGLIGTAPLLLAVIITFLIALKALYKRKDPLLRGCAFACLMSMLAMAVHATVDFNLQIPANAASFMLILALGWIGMYFPRRAES